MESSDSGAGMGRHNLSVSIPSEIVLKVDAKISDHIGPSHREDPAAREPQ